MDTVSLPGAGDPGCLALRHLERPDAVPLSDRRVLKQAPQVLGVRFTDRLQAQAIGEAHAGGPHMLLLHAGPPVGFRSVDLSTRGLGGVCLRLNTYSRTESIPVVRCSTSGMLGMAPFFACAIGRIEQHDEWLDLQSSSC